MLLTDSEDATVFSGLLGTTIAMMGNFHVDQYQSVVSLSMFLIFLVLMIIVMFNVLIAIVGDRYTDVMDDVEVEVRKLRALMIVEEQAMMVSTTARKRLVSLGCVLTPTVLCCVPERGREAQP